MTSLLDCAVDPTVLIQRIDFDARVIPLADWLLWSAIAYVLKHRRHERLPAPVDPRLVMNHFCIWHKNVMQCAHIASVEGLLKQNLVGGNDLAPQFLDGCGRAR